MREKIIYILQNKSEKFQIKYEKLEEKYFCDNTQKRLFIGSVIFFALCIFTLNFLTPLIADDYGWGYIFGTAEKIKDLKDIFKSMYNFYFNWGGRISGEFYNELCVLLGKNLFNIINTIIYIINSLLIYKICSSNDKKTDVSLYIGINLIIWFFTPDYGQIMFWISGSCNYLWAMTPILIMIFFYRKHSLGETIIKNKVLSTVIFFIVGIIAGWASENGSAGMLVILTLYLVYYYINKISISSDIVLGYLGSLIGFALLILAPGNAVRKVAEQNSVHTTILFRFFMITYFFVMFLGGIFILLSLIIFIGNKYFGISKNKSIINMFIFVFASICSAYCMIASPTSPERTWFCVVVYLTIGIGIIYSNFDFKSKVIDVLSMKMLRRTFISITGISMCIFCVMYLDTVLATYEINVQTKIREEYILSEKSKGNLDIVTPIISHKYPLLSNHDALYGLDDITTDSDHFTNRAVCKYYGINSVTGIEPKEKQYLN